MRLVEKVSLCTLQDGHITHEVVCTPQTDERNVPHGQSGLPGLLQLLVEGVCAPRHLPLGMIAPYDTNFTIVPFIAGVPILVEVERPLLQRLVRPELHTRLRQESIASVRQTSWRICRLLKFGGAHACRRGRGVSMHGSEAERGSTARPYFAMGVVSRQPCFVCVGGFRRVYDWGRGLSEADIGSIWKSIGLSTTHHKAEKEAEFIALVHTVVYDAPDVWLEIYFAWRNGFNVGEERVHPNRPERPPNEDDPSRERGMLACDEARQVAVYLFCTIAHEREHDFCILWCRRRGHEVLERRKICFVEWRRPRISASVYNNDPRAMLVCERD